MSWNDDDNERFRNLLLFKFYGTDKEMEGIAPFVITLGILCFILWILLG